MSGHSKWSKVKHQKEASDAAKGRTFTKLIRAIMVAVKEGGEEPASNFKLRLAIEKARSANMPKENIQRAIEKAKGGKEGDLSEMVYEALGPQGVALMIKVATDNKQRTVAKLKNILEQSGGVLVTSGAVSHLFDYLGMIQVPKKEKSFDQMLEAALEAGAADLKEEGGYFLILTKVEVLHRVKESLESLGWEISSCDLVYRPKTFLSFSGEAAEKIKNLLTRLEEDEDVQKVYSNCVFQNVT